jgi:hypothetical protein
MELWEGGKGKENDRTLALSQNITSVKGGRGKKCIESS